MLMRIGLTALMMLSVVGVSGTVMGQPASEREMSQLIDRHIDAKLAEAGLQPVDRASDAEFMRRVSLDLTGRIPTADRVRTFLDDRSSDKRAKFIDELLAAPAHGRFHAYQWRDLIAKRDDVARAVESMRFVEWLTGRINANDGWDKIVSSLITAQGSVEVRGNVVQSQVPELYLMVTQIDAKQEPSPSRLAAVVGNLFLGVQIQCAECHRHPVNREWSRDDFWGLAAFFSKVRGVDEQGQAPDPTSKTKTKVTRYGEVDEIKVRIKPPGGKESVRVLPKGLSIEVPDKVDEFTVDHVVKGRFLGGTEPEPGEKGPFRPVLADWLTARDNPYFAKTTVNRLWGQMFGRGFVNPLNDLHPENPPSHPELLDALAKDFAASGYDRKRMLRVICNSATYQRTSAKVENAEKMHALFGSRKVRIMNADQLLDSLFVARGVNPDTQIVGAKDGNKGSGERPVGAFNITTLEDDPADYNYGVPQALKLLNARLTSVSVAKTLEKLPPEQALERLYLTAYARRPTPEDIRLVEGYMTKSKTGYDGLLFALLNSAEFCSVR